MSHPEFIGVEPRPEVVRTLTTPIPFGKNLLFALNSVPSTLNPPYIRWQSVRHPPGKSTGSGFEGFFAGMKDVDFEGKMVDFGMQGLRILRSCQPSVRSGAWNLLTGERFSVDAARELDIILRIFLARARAERAVNVQATEFRDALATLNDINIFYDTGANRQSIHMLALPKISIPEFQSSIHDPSNPLGFMSMIGLVGHPLIRSALDLRNIRS